MTRSRHLAGRFERPRRWRRLGMWTALLILVAMVGAYLFLTSSQRLSRLAGGLLEDMTGAQVHIGEASFGLNGLIHLHDVTLLVPEMGGDEPRIFHAGEVLIRHDLLSLLQGRFVARSLTLSQPTLYITEDSDTGRFNYEHLRREEKDTPRDFPDTLPEVYIREGTIVRGEVSGDRYTPVFRFHVDGKLTEDAREHSRYHFSLRQLAAEGEADHAGGPRLLGNLNLQTMNVEVELDRFTVETRQGDVLPRRLRQWWQMMQPEGEFSSIRISYDPEAEAFAALLEVKNTALTLPYLNREASSDAEPSPEQRQFRLTDVSGRFAIVNDRIHISNLRGMVEGIEYVINGTIDGLDREAPFTLSLTTQPFAIPQEPTFLPALPHAVRTSFDRFQPSGMFQFALELSRARGKPIAYRGRVDLHDARFTYARFAYPLQQVRGHILFDDELVRIENVTATGPTGARLILNGQIAPPDEAAAVHITIAATQVPFDEYIYTALPPRNHRIIDMFADEEALARLHETGAMPQNADFQIGGKGRYDVVITRAPGPDQPVKTDVTMHMAGMQVVFTHWPYPLKLTGGTLHIGDELVEVRDVTAEGLHGGGGVARGWIHMPRDPQTRQRGFIPDLHIEARGLPMNDLLLAAIAEPHNEWLRQMHLTGRIDAEAQVFHNDQQRIDYRIQARLADGTARPFGGGYVLDELTAATAVGDGGVTFDAVRGRHGESDLTFAGGIRHENEQPLLHIDFTGVDLRFEDALLDLIPSDHAAAEALSRLFTEYQPTGVFNARLTYARSGGDETYDLIVEPRTLGLDWRDQRIELHQGRGAARIRPNAIQLQRFGADLDHASFDLTGEVTLDEPLRMNLLIDARADRLDDTVRLILPGPVLDAIDALQMDGRITMRNARLRYEAAHGSSGAAPAFSFQGTVNIEEGVAQVGVPIDQLSGELAIRAARRSGERWPWLEFDLRATRLRAAQRAVTPLRLRLASVAQPSVLELSELRGSVYGGLLRGQGMIDFEADRYAFSLVLLDAPLDPVIHPEKYPASDAEAADDVAEGQGPLIIRAASGRDVRQLLRTGRLSVSLDVESRMDQPDTRRGRGELEIRGARMYELPLAMTLLQVLNLSAPASGAFDEANASFVIDGDRVLFDAVNITAPTIALTGDGMMRYSDRSLDLMMVSTNPQGPDLGVLSDMLSLVKDELVSVHVGGTLDDPQPQMTNFRGLRASWRALFGGQRRVIEPSGQ